MSIHENSDVRVPINQNSKSITREEDKCILCGNCRSTCKYTQGVYGNYSLEETNDVAICIDCGQCIQACPTKAVCEVKDYKKVKELIKDPYYTFVFQTAPSVRVALGEEFGLEVGSFVQEQMVTALRRLGATYVFDTAYGADLTVMEEACELLERIENEERMPMFTSCCPAWVKFVEYFYPEWIPNLSTCKSPISMEGTLIKTYFAEQKKINPKKIISIAVTPCTAKKAEIKREELKILEHTLFPVDFVITTHELACWLKEEEIDFVNLEPTHYDTFLADATGAGLLFGATGGVMEATLRTLYFYITGEKLSPLEFETIRGLEGIKEAKIKIGDIELKTAVITGTQNAHTFLNLLKKGVVHYDFVEVMACLGGCVLGGGQPKLKDAASLFIKEKRGNSLYEKDKVAQKRCSYENLEIQKLYATYFKKPGSPLALKLLHTSYASKAKILNPSVKKTGIGC